MHFKLILLCREKFRLSPILLGRAMDLISNLLERAEA